MTTDASNESEQMGGTNEPKDTPKDEGRTFTQEELNRIVGARVREEASKYADYSDLQKAAEELATIRESQMTAEDKLRSQVAEAQSRSESLEARIVTTAIRADIQTKAAQMGIDADAAVAMVDRAGIRYDIESESVTGTEDALHQLVEMKPFLRANYSQADAPAPNLNGKSNGTPDSSPSLTQDQKDAARALGLSEEAYANGLAKAPK